MIGKPTHLVSAIAPSSRLRLTMMRQLWITTVVLGAVSIGSWTMYLKGVDSPNGLSVGIFLTMLCILTVNYLLTLSRDSRDWLPHAALLAIFTVVTPTYLETDHYRYVWDGLHLNQGLNPFLFTPENHPDFAAISWAQLINHQHLHSIYPPVAQIFFAISSWLNPYFWPFLFDPSQIQSVDGLSPFQLTLGWKVFIAITLLCCMYTLRSRGWSYIFLNPLIIMQFLMNAHLDGFLIPLLLLIFYGSSKMVYLRGFAFVSAIMLKVYPIILLPFLIIKEKGKWFPYLGVISLSGTLMFFSFYLSSQGNMLTSFFVFGKHWSFFGYIHQILVDLMRLAGYGNQAIASAKLIGAFLGLTLFLTLVWQVHLKSISIRLASLILVTGFWMLSPTLHPWYLIAILGLALPYKKLFLTPVVWTCLSLASITTYINNQDPIIIRYVCYTIITACLIKDIKVISKHIRRKKEIL